MTREEAIARIKDHKIIHKRNEPRAIYISEALDMAIKALEYDDVKYHEEHGEVIVDNEVWDDAKKALEQEPCEDAISRQATVERLCKLADFMNKKREGLGSPYIMAALFIQDNKNEFPSVNPQQTGHWKRISIDKYSEHAKYWYRCDRCGKDNLGNTDWCPNCGAKMDESQESEDKE